MALAPSRRDLCSLGGLQLESTNGHFLKPWSVLFCLAIENVTRPRPRPHSTQEPQRSVRFFGFQRAETALPRARLLLSEASSQCLFACLGVATLGFNKRWLTLRDPRLAHLSLHSSSCSRRHVHAFVMPPCCCSNYAGTSTSNREKTSSSKACLALASLWKQTRRSRRKASVHRKLLQALQEICLRRSLSFEYPCPTTAKDSLQAGNRAHRFSTISIESLGSRHFETTAL